MRRRPPRYTRTDTLFPYTTLFRSTIKTYQADESASTRLAVWKWTIDFAKKSPFGGGFEAYRQNQIRYNTVKIEGQGPQQTVDKTLEVDKARAYHSAYFEMLGEQGYPGLNRKSTRLNSSH